MVATTAEGCTRWEKGSALSSRWLVKRASTPEAELRKSTATKQDGRSFVKPSADEHEPCEMRASAKHEPCEMRDLGRQCAEHSSTPSRFSLPGSAASACLFRCSGTLNQKSKIEMGTKQKNNKHETVKSSYEETCTLTSQMARNGCGHHDMKRKASLLASWGPL